MVFAQLKRKKKRTIVNRVYNGLNESVNCQIISIIYELIIRFFCITVETTTAEPTTDEPTTMKPITAVPTSAELTTVGPTRKEQTTAEPTLAELTIVGPNRREQTTAEPTSAEPTTKQGRTVRWHQNNGRSASDESPVPEMLDAFGKRT